MADPAVVVLSSEDFGSIDDMLIARQVISALVLYRVRAGELAAVLVQLREGDDVCLADDPQVRAAAAARIRDALRASDWAARYGGEEIAKRDGRDRVR